MLYATGIFLLTSPELALFHPEQVELNGAHYVSRPAALEVFSADRGQSVLRIPLAERRRQLEALPWVEKATVRRALPNRIEVELVERSPIAFLREETDLALIDGHGVILERPLEGNFHFPVVSGIRAAMSLEERERRMQLFSGFLGQIEATRTGASELVSEVDLSDARDLQATLSGLPTARQTKSANPAAEAFASSPLDPLLLVHFGDRDFQSRYQTLLDNIGQWRATAGRVDSVDLRFDREVVVNPDRGMAPVQTTTGSPPAVNVKRPTTAKAASNKSKRRGIKRKH